MQFDFAKLDMMTGYKLLTATVTPRPIAWVTTCDAEGLVNAAPYSFFNVVGSAPPTVVLGLLADPERGFKDTARNIRETGEFVVHMVDEPLGEAMVTTSATLPRGESELDNLPLTTLPSEKIAVPRIAEAPVAFECTEHSTIEIGSNRLVIGVVHFVHIRDGLADEKGYVYYPNVNVVEEMADMISASRSFQINVQIAEAAKTLSQRVLALGHADLRAILEALFAD